MQENEGNGIKYTIYLKCDNNSRYSEPKVVLVESADWSETFGAKAGAKAGTEKTATATLECIGKWRQ